MLRGAGCALFLLVVLLGLMPGAAHAEGGLLLVDPVPETAQWSDGATLFLFPSYPGAIRRDPLPIPAFEWLSPSGLFVSTDLGLGWNASRRKDLQYGVRLWPALPRSAGDGPRLHGLPGIPLRIERSLFANWIPFEFLQLQSTLRTGLGADGRGTLAEFGTSFGAPLGQRVVAGATIGMSWANQSWRQSWFGIDPQAAAASGYHPFLAGAGWQDFQLAVGGEWQLAEQWRLDIRTEHWRLLGAAAASPLTEARWQHGLVLSLWHDIKP
ncbi:MAG: MipA/OmpV family protein [Pseudomonadota bacterium]|nr:MipA/OmpV family protein [Pseudomonadota bacterium]